ncbi:MAG TPA: alpha/beta fold hydrolase [Candidatus Krumholzibacteria bacterium]|nr:alpha/beta fold hydrolase [Candidatus Krumholzibacteria bacterium]
MPPSIRFCRAADNVRIAFSSNGSGPPLVQAPTWLTHLELDWESAAWCDWLTALSQFHTLVRYDLRGCGLSDRHPEDQSIDSWVMDLEAVVDALELERFPLFGICQGGAIAAAYTARHPERVSCLVLYGSYVQGALSREPLPPQAEEIKALATLIEHGWGRDSPAFREVFSCMLMPDAKAERIRALTDLERRSATPEMARCLWLAFHSIDIADLVTRISVPTLVLHCRGDGMVPFEEGRRTATLIPGAQFIALEGRNHILQPDEAAWDEMWDVVQPFLAENDSQAGLTALGDLTTREQELLDLIARGRSNAEISAELQIAPKTVRNHVSNIFSKLGVSHRAEAIVMAREAGFGH